MKVLLVEDHPALARISGDLLRDVHGHEVETAADARAALDAVGHFTPDVVLIDVNLPDFNGYELAARLRQRPELADTVLVALTAFGQELTAAQAKAAGIDAQYRKPMDFEVLPDLQRTRA